MTALADWGNFYVIVGSSAGALIGLQFVVMTLMAEMPMRPDMELAGHAFATPNIIHFGAALLLSALMSAPWHGSGTAGILCLVAGLCGVAYVLVVARRMRLQTAYRPVLEDWLFHAGLPVAAYAMLAVSGYAGRAGAGWPLFVAAAAALLLLFIGIHNAWDAVTYHVFAQRRSQQKSDESQR